MAPFDEPLVPNALDSKQASDVFTRLFSYVTSAESYQELDNRFNLSRSYLAGWIHGGGDTAQAKTFEDMIHAALKTRRQELISN